MSHEAQFQPQIEDKENKHKNLAKCRWCRSMNIVKKGFRKTQNRGKIQRFLCNDCKRSFCKDEGFYRMRNSPEKITAAIDLYFSNLSSRKVRNHFRRHLKHNSSHVTVLDWCRRYVMKVYKYTERLTPELSGQFYADDTEIDCQRRKDHLWCNVDWGTRFINGFHYSIFSGLKEAKEFLKKTTKHGLPKFIQTDAAMFYPKAFHQLFYTNKLGEKGGLKVEHRIINHQKTRKYNVRIETVFMKIKDRVDDFRGLKALWSAPILLMGIVLQHNYIEAHTTTGAIPCELAGLKLDVGENRWLGLIKMASIQ